MRVKELIERLKDYPEDMEVHMAYGSGDYWRTVLAPAVTQIDMGFVQYTDYHRMDKLVEPDFDEEPEDGVKAVVVLE